MTFTNDNLDSDIDSDLAAALQRAFGEGQQSQGEDQPTASDPPPETTTGDENPEGENEAGPDAQGDGELDDQSPDVELGDGVADQLAEEINDAIDGAGGEPVTVNGVDLNALAKHFYGDQVITREQAEALFQVAHDLNNLTPEQQQGIAAILYGDNGQQQPQPQPQPHVPQVESQGDYSPDPMLAAIEEDYPEIAQAIKARDQLTQQQIAELTNWRNDYESRQVQEQNRRYQEGVEKGWKAWHAEHPEFTVEELTALSVKSGAGMYAGALVQQQGLDPATAVQRALDAAVLSDPTYKQKVIDAEVARRSTELNKNLNKKRKAAALTGSGGPASRELPPVDVRDPDARRAAMRQAVVSARNEGVTSPSGE